MTEEEKQLIVREDNGGGAEEVTHTHTHTHTHTRVVNLKPLVGVCTCDVCSPGLWDEREREREGEVEIDRYMHTLIT